MKQPTAQNCIRRPSSHPAKHPSTRQVCRCTQPRLEELSRASLECTATVARERVHYQTTERESCDTEHHSIHSSILHKPFHNPFIHPFKPLQKPSTKMLGRNAFPRYWRDSDIWSGVWRSQPPPPPPPNGMVWYRGGGECGEGWGLLELQVEKRPGVTDKAGIVRKPYASHKSYNVAQ